MSAELQTRYITHAITALLCFTSDFKTLPNVRTNFDFLEKYDHTIFFVFSTQCGLLWHKEGHSLNVGMTINKYSS